MSNGTTVRRLFSYSLAQSFTFDQTELIKSIIPTNIKISGCTEPALAPDVSNISLSTKI